ncbi:MULTISPECIES: type II secretion system F family protein [unclassified Streptomyces]|uniref:type II secretion system F family protein n=1 Tax=unclassified Streptomyces TaxID=2593676 RepID=UPI002255D67C|nr:MULTISPECIES: type II secretion system F family protein [unclassified Streptomyces]MCX5332223.1 type II secretion system F family protein [Streptomyces sp. NBC_00140]MCX5361601.1 type II secretion system F family protein [Streptomyces sp. NBC_00124]
MGGLFSTEVLFSIASGVAVGGGIALFAIAVRGLPAKPDHEKQKAAERASELIRFAGQRGSLAAIVGIVVLLLTQWAVAGIAAGVLVFFWDRLFGGAGEERAAMKRVEALAGWTESLRDTIAGAVGLEQAIPASARASAPVLRPHLDALVDRLRARTPLPDALQHLADEINDASADIIVAALILNARLRGPGLRQVLGALAKSAREEVDMRNRVMAQRASTRRSVQIVVAVSVAFVLGLSVFNREFVEPYGTAIGQVVLAIVCGLFALGFWWLRKLSTIETPERFLIKDDASVQFVRPRTPSQQQPVQPSQEEGVRR